MPIDQREMNFGRVDDERVATIDLDSTIGGRVMELDTRTAVESLHSAVKFKRDVNGIFKQGRRRGKIIRRLGSTDRPTDQEPQDGQKMGQVSSRSDHGAAVDQSLSLSLRDGVESHESFLQI